MTFPIQLKTKEVKIMDKYDEKMFAEQGEIKIVLSVSKRAIPLSLKANQQERLEENGYGNLAYFHNNYKTSFSIRKGDVILARFDGACGNEIQKPHFVVAISDSKANNPLVTVVPLKSSKTDKELNPASDIAVGNIRGVLNGKETVAVINQIRAIDKCRLFEPNVLFSIDSIYNERKQENDDVTGIQLKNVYRLSDEQFKSVLKAVVQYVSTGFIKH